MFAISVCFVHFIFAGEQNSRIMSRSVTKIQSEILLSKIESNRSIACGFVKDSKHVVAAFWNTLTAELNSAGPPLKSAFEWKKVWTDQKRYVRTKAAGNKKNQSQTGGGKNKSIPLTAHEEKIYELIGMKESIDGVESSRNFGLTLSVNINKENENPADYEDMVEEYLDAINEEPTCSNEKTVGENTCPATPSLKRKHKDSSEKVSTLDLVAKEVEVQEKLYIQIAEITQSVKEHNPQIQSMVNRVYRSLEKMNDIQIKKYKELERHNAILEEYRKQEVESKIEKNKRLIEIEEMKLAIMQKKS